MARKHIRAPQDGIAVPEEKINPKAFNWQNPVIRWSLRTGRAAEFADTGLGKSFLQTEYARHVVEYTNKPFLILAPLAVAQQTVREAEKFGIVVPVKRVSHSSEITKPQIYITNYEKLHHFDASVFGGVALDESSILKSHTGQTRQAIMDAFAGLRFKLSCTATPAPNDHMELGNQSEFLQVLSRNEMLSTFFVHDGGETSKWRLRGHAEQKFWEWMSTWAIMLRNPRDIGYECNGYDLPPLTIEENIIETERAPGMLFSMEAKTLSDQRAARRNTIEGRIDAMVQRIRYGEPNIVWCNLNDESKAATEALKDKGAVEITGSDSPEYKEEMMLAFSDGQIPILVSKPDICGFGMNWQHCCQMDFLGLSHSFESLYQAIRRCYRFGQTKPVTVRITISDQETAILDNVKRKEAESRKMATGMIAAMGDWTRKRLQGFTVSKSYNPTKQMKVPQWLQQAS